jgi:hypothetical protein
MLERVKKFCKDHEDEFIILGTSLVASGCVTYVIAKTVIRNGKATHVTVYNGSDEPPKDMIVQVFYRDGTSNAFGYKPRV